MSTLNKLRGTATYIAPETCKGEKYTVKSDIYSVGICFWEMAYRCVYGKYQTPFAEYNIENSIQIIMRTPTGFRPTMPSPCPAMIVTLIETCWDTDPNKRPVCEQLLKQLTDCQEHWKANPQLWPTPSTSTASIDTPLLTKLFASTGSDPGSRRKAVSRTNSQAGAVAAFPPSVTSDSPSNSELESSNPHFLVNT
jgi:serine/threonine protein kinase